MTTICALAEKTDEHGPRLAFESFGEWPGR